MNIVVVAPRFPFPLDKGDRLTVFHLLKFLSARHTVSLACFLEPEQDPAWVEKVAPFCQEVVTVPLNLRRAYWNCATGFAGRTPLQLRYYQDADMRRAVDGLIRRQQPDLLYAHTIRMGQYIEQHATLPRVLAMQISMTLNYRRLAERATGLAAKLFNGLEYRKVRKFEGAFATRFDKVLLISPHDLKAVEAEEPLQNVFFSPHGVDFEFFTRDAAIEREPASIIFTGNMNYAPNVDAAIYFYTQIFPLIRQELPAVTWKIVGADPAPEIQALAQEPAITVTGRVPDLRTFMSGSEVAIDPLRIGAGLQNKVLEGMSMGLPMVITAVANEGIQASHGENILIADTPERFAENVLRLLKDAAMRQELGAAAREFIVTKWSWEKHFGDLETMFTTLAHGP